MSPWAGDNAASSEVTIITAERILAPPKIILSCCVCLVLKVSELCLRGSSKEKILANVPSLKTLEAHSVLTPFHFSSFDVNLKKKMVRCTNLHMSEHTHYLEKYIKPKLSLVLEVCDSKVKCTGENSVHITILPVRLFQFQQGSGAVETSTDQINARI